MEVEDKVSLKVMETLGPMGIYIIPFLGLRDLNPLRLGSLNLAQNGS